MLAILLLAASLDPQLVDRLGAPHPESHETVVQSATADELDEHGKVTHTQRVVTRVSWPDGKRKVELLSAQEDGKPSQRIREKFDEEQKNDTGDEKNSGPLQNPFAPGVRDHYAFEALGTEGRLLHVRVEPKQRDDKLLQGELWIDPDAAAVVRSHVHPAKNPRFVDLADFEVTYELTPAGARLARMDGRFAGGMFFFKKRGRSTMTFAYGKDADAAARDVVSPPPSAPAAAH